MKKIITIITLLIALTANIWAVPTWNYENAHIENMKQITFNEMTEEQADQLLELISLDTPFFEELLLEKGYYSIYYNDGSKAIWFMFVNEGKIFSFQTGTDKNNELHYYLSEWKTNK